MAKSSGVACECHPGLPLAAHGVRRRRRLHGRETCDGGGLCGGGASTCACETDDDCLAHDDGDLCNGRLLCTGRHCVFDPETW